MANYKLSNTVYTDKVDNVSVAQAADMNGVQDEIAYVENVLGGVIAKDVDINGTLNASTITAGTGGFVGKNALYRQTTNSITSDSIPSMTGTENVIYGSPAERVLTTGNNNTSIGNSTGKSMTTGSYNSLIGSGCGAKLTTGSSNAAIGFDALTNLVDGTGNVAIGVRAFGAATSMYNSVAIGGGAGDTATTGERNIFIGRKAGRFETAVSHTLYIDAEERADLAACRAGAIITGKMSTNPASQELRFNVGKMGFFGTPPVVKPTITGSRSSNAALASLLTELEALGLLTDESS